MPTIKEIDKFINKVTIDKPVIIVRNSFYYELEQLMKLAKKEVFEDIDNNYTYGQIVRVLKELFIDKQIVNDAIDKVIPLDENCANNMILNNQLKKELGSDKQ